ncbi:hypothetical protein V865_005535 [Kwoniella europaea PYCC6329]|uniref:NADH:ubiquinone oxidoreductase intermediate-associated protein 30 domain-containing protein n=1 Tax=Kwoniella europaea PYCC6329 TaxID=1423913 RepID=A0AAX4KLW3_9TREE
MLILSLCPFRALIGRQAIRGLLDNKSKVEGGISLLTSSGQGFSGIGRSFNTISYSSKRTEEGEGYEIKSEYGTKHINENENSVSVGGPLVKVRVEHNSATSEPDLYAISHPHLWPVEAMSTANRDHSNRSRQPIEGLENISYRFSVNRPWRNSSEGFISTLHIEVVKFKKANNLDNK